MDRYDEKKHDDMTHDRDRDEPGLDHAHTDRDQEPERTGDVLGLGGGPVPKAPGDPHTEYDEESIAQRRARAAGGGSRLDHRDHDLERGKGATGIDMGSGGTGTDVGGE